LPEDIQSRAGRFSEEITGSPGFVEPLLPLLARITQPALLIKGEHDPVTSPEEISCFRSDVPGGAYHFADGTGHFLHAEAPTDYAKLVTQFVLG
jgi:proline iminopeptidase